MDVSSDPFEALVVEALAEIPDEFRRYLDNVAIVIEDEPAAPWLGVYQGHTARYRDLPASSPT